MVTQINSFYNHVIFELNFDENEDEKFLKHGLHDKVESKGR